MPNTNPYPAEGGDLGIGIAVPTAGQIEVQTQHDAATAGRGIALSIVGGARTRTAAQLYLRPNAAGDNYKLCLTRDSQDDLGVVIEEDGKVSVPQDLTLGGKLILDTWELEVADYVFGDDYELPTLESVREFVEEHHHLPAMDSAAEIERDGLDLSRLSLSLLRKVEELTLYVIQQNELIKEQRDGLQQLSRRISTAPTGQAIGP